MFTVTNQKAAVEHIEMLSRRRKKDQISGFEFPCELLHRLLRNARKTRRQRTKARNNIEQPGLGSAGNVRRYPANCSVAAVVTNPLSHVVIPLFPRHAATIVT